jgi:hypothetical protein
MIRFAGFCLTVVVVSFILVDVCGVRPADLTTAALATRLRSIVVSVSR